MICKVCKSEFDDRFTKCPYCGNSVVRDEQQYPQYQQSDRDGGVARGQERNNVSSDGDGYRDVSSGRANTASVFDEEEYEDNGIDATEDEDYDYDDLPVRTGKFKFIIGGIAIGVVAFSLGLCILYFTGAIGSRHSDVTTEVSTTEEATPLVTTSQENTTEATTEATTETTVPASTELDDNGNPLPDVYYDTPETLTINASAGLNLRKGPGTEHGKIKLLSSKTKVIAVGKSVTISDWLYVYYEAEKLYGWASVKYLDGVEALEGSEAPTEESTTEESTAEESTAEATSEATTEGDERPTDASGSVTPEKKYDSELTYYVSASSGLNLRKGPGSDNARVAVLNKNTEVTAIGYNSDNSDWVYVYCASNGEYGWLSIKYLSQQKLQ